MQSEKSNLISALISFQKQVPDIPKNKVNSFFNNSRYADLSSVIAICLPVLNSNGLAISQVICANDGHNILTTRLFHESGESMESTIYLPAIADPQKLTAAITYLRRSSYLCILGLVADDDDDGNSVSQTQKPSQATVNTDSPASDAQLVALKKMYPGKDLSRLTKNEAKKMFDEFNKGKK